MSYYVWTNRIVSEIQAIAEGLVESLGLNSVSDIILDPVQDGWSELSWQSAKVRVMVAEALSPGVIRARLVGVARMSGPNEDDSVIIE